MGRYINRTHKGTSLRGKTSYDIFVVTIGPLVHATCVHDEEIKKETKKETLQWKTKVEN